MPRRLPFAPVETVTYRQLLPGGADTDADAFLSALTLRHESRDIQRPYTIVNFVASVDGRATIDGRSRKLGDAGDRELFRALRERADAVLVGTGTLAAESYGRMLVQAERRERRTAAGRPPEPLVATISRSVSVPLGIPLFQEPEAHVVVFSPMPPVMSTLTKLAARLDHRPLQFGHQSRLRPIVESLAHDYDVRVLLCEGGPKLFGALLRERLVDELFLTLAPKLVGGASGPAVVSGPPPEVPVAVTLASALERDGSLFLRYTFD
jgi:riboflavin biosynthesis pyrimidine reductase